jgi:hypothetical protein
MRSIKSLVAAGISIVVLASCAGQASALTNRIEAGCTQTVSATNLHINSLTKTAVKGSNSFVDTVNLAGGAGSKVVTGSETYSSEGTVSAVGTQTSTTYSAGSYAQVDTGL